MDLSCGKNNASSSDLIKNNEILIKFFIFTNLSKESFAIFDLLN